MKLVYLINVYILITFLLHIDVLLFYLNYNAQQILVHIEDNFKTEKSWIYTDMLPHFIHSLKLLISYINEITQINFIVFWHLWNLSYLINITKKMTVFLDKTKTKDCFHCSYNILFTIISQLFIQFCSTN